jgi:uncharacterized LabA/DUF88 family protein
VLLDGGFVKYALKEKRADPPINEEVVRTFVSSIAKLPALEGARLHRVYFYDAKPLTGKVNRPDGEVLDFSASKLTQISQSQHASLARLPYVAMRYGELSYRGWRVKEKVLRKAKELQEIAPEDLEPNVQQKGVDMRIGLDIAALTLKRQASIIVLVTGDSDLVPAMKFARREGCQLVLITLGGNVKEPMYDHADVVIDDKSWIEYPKTGEVDPA